MRRSICVLASIAALTSGCYHAVIETGRPASATVIDKPWANSFIGGLVPPAPLETSASCPSGVAKVETQHSFLNMLVGAVTFGIYTPMQITVTCAQGGRAEAGKIIDARGDHAALENAAIAAEKSNEPIYLMF